jgi:hypothetical protein
MVRSVPACSSVTLIGDFDANVGDRSVTLARRRMLRVRFFIMAGLFSLPAMPLSARIGDPTLPELVATSSSIATGRVLAVLPTPFSPLSLLGMVLLTALLIGRQRWRQRRRGSAALSAVGIFILGSIASLTLVAFTPFDVYQNVALVHVEQTHRGQIRGVVPVFFGTSFVCDVSDVDVGERYVLFLNDSVVGYQPSWYDWSFWTATDTTVQPQRLRWAKQQPVSYTDFIRAVSADSAGRDGSDTTHGSGRLTRD